MYVTTATTTERIGFVSLADASGQPLWVATIRGGRSFDDIRVHECIVEQSSGMIYIMGVRHLSLSLSQV